ncbi:hypothetical protein EDF56_102321 [Novosphingobium sp. PhB165]|nr:hypothetical protein EDF56_102321 [Novosphingobium sp. PhB165]
MFSQAQRLSELQEIAAALRDVLERLDACGQTLAAVHVQHGLDLLQANANEDDPV